MFTDYQARVLEFYEKKRGSGKLSINLVHPTAGKVKRECLLVYQLRHSREDLAMLRVFLGERENATEYERALRAFDTEKFKPLAVFLKKVSGKTDEKNIELLAWLIDFSPRPYRFETDYSRAQKPETDDSIPEEFIELDEKEVDEISGGSPTFKKQSGMQESSGSGALEPAELRTIQGSKLRRNVLIVAAFLIGAAVILYSKTGDNRNSIQSLFSSEGCMYWTGDRYEQVDCSQEIPNTEVVALRSNLLDNFKRITKPDTLREEHIDQVFYSKMNGELELYTMEGRHPKDPKRHLKPLTRYMFERYVEKKIASQK